jgi:hypothetical protein
LATHTEREIGNTPHLEHPSPPPHTTLITHPPVTPTLYTPTPPYHPTPLTQHYPAPTPSSQSLTLSSSGCGSGVSRWSTITIAPLARASHVRLSPSQPVGLAVTTIRASRMVYCLFKFSVSDELRGEVVVVCVVGNGSYQTCLWCVGVYGCVANVHVYRCEFICLNCSLLFYCLVTENSKKKEIFTTLIISQRLT